MMSHKVTNCKDMRHHDVSQSMGLVVRNLSKPVSGLRMSPAKYKRAIVRMEKLFSGGVCQMHIGTMRSIVCVEKLVESHEGKLVKAVTPGIYATIVGRKSWTPYRAKCLLNDHTL